MSDTPDLGAHPQQSYRDPAGPQAQALHQVADQFEALADQIRQADLRHLAEQAAGIAQRNPLLFVGGAALAGFAAARFFKARSSHPVVVEEADPWGGPLPGAHSAGAAAPQGHPHG